MNAMNIWLIGGGVYVIALLFALALCRVASPNGQREPRSVAYEPSSARVSRESEVAIPNPAAP